MTGAQVLQVWFFELRGEDRVAALLQQVQYAGPVEAVALNAEHAAVLCQGVSLGTSLDKCQHEPQAQIALASHLFQVRSLGKKHLTTSSQILASISCCGLVLLAACLQIDNA